MLSNDYQVRLNSVLDICIRHQDRMNYALAVLEGCFPVNLSVYRSLTPEQIAHTDQYLYRFSQLQDTLGSKLFPMVLQGLGEYDPGMPLIDVLNRLERLGILENAEKWLELREIRNLVTHEYPDNEKDIVEGLNELIQKSAYLDSAFQRASQYIKNRWPG